MLLVHSTVRAQPDQGPDEDPQGDLDRARSSWPGYLDYTFVYDGNPSSGIAAKEVVVKNGAVASVDGSDSPQDLLGIPTIEGLYDEIQTHIDRGAPRISTWYSVYGSYPLYINIKYEEITEMVIARIYYLIPQMELDQQRRELAEAKETWKQSGFPDYVYEIETSGFLPLPPMGVEVKNDQVFSRFLSVWEPLPEYAGTVEDMYNFIEDKIGRVAKLDVSYDDKLGYPTSVFVDFSEFVLDEEVSFTVLRFFQHPIPDAQERLWEAREQWPQFSDYIYQYWDSVIKEYVKVRVENFGILEVSFTINDEPAPQEVVDKVPQVQGLFDKVQQAIDKSLREFINIQDSISVEYNDRYGYPLRVYFNFGANDPENFDAELFNLVPQIDIDKNRRTLGDANVLWSTFDLGTYNYTIRLQGFIPPSWQEPVLVVVQDGVVVDRIYEGIIESLDSFLRTLDRLAIAIPSLFSFIANEIDKLEMADVYQLDVTYHPSLGYPTSVYIDPFENALDEQIYFELTNLVVSAANEICVGLPCCVEDCCGPASRWDSENGLCVLDLLSSGFDPTTGYPPDYDPGCKPFIEWACCGEACCDESVGTKWDGVDSCLGQTGP